MLIDKFVGLISQKSINAYLANVKSMGKIRIKRRKFVKSILLSEKIYGKFKMSGFSKSLNASLGDVLILVTQSHESKTFQTLTIDLFLGI